MIILIVLVWFKYKIRLLKKIVPWFKYQIGLLKRTLTHVRLSTIVELFTGLNNVWGDGGFISIFYYLSINLLL